MSAPFLNRAAGRARREVRQIVEPAATAIWRRRVIGSGTDVTAASTRLSCVVFAPHPDDETIGCGAAIARKRASGTAVRVVVATDGRFSHQSEVLSPDRLAAVRAGEVADACARLGVEPDELILLGHHEGTLSTDLDRLEAEIADHIVDFTPDEVLVTSGRDWHQDHQTLNRAVRRALDRVRDTTRPELREFPVWLWADGPWRGPTAPRGIGSVLQPFGDTRSMAVELVSTVGFVEVKREALGCHRSQTSNITGEPAWPVLDHTFVARFLGQAEIFLGPMVGASSTHQPSPATGRAS